MMAFLPPGNDLGRGTTQNGCPYFAIDPSGQPKCAADDILGDYLPHLHPVGVGEFCRDTAGKWGDCIAFKRAKLL